MALSNETSMIGFSTSQAYEDEESVSDQSEETTSDSDVEMMTAQPSSSKVFPTPKSSDENLHAETPDKRVPLPRTREISNAETTGRPRPWGLQHAIAVSAPEVPQQLPRKDITTTKLGDQRSVSQRHSTITLEEPNQNPQSLQRMEKSENFLPLASSSANKRRRSDQDAAHKNNKTPQDLSRVRRIPCHSRSLPPSSSPPFRKIPFPGNLTETPKGNNSKLEVDSSDDDDRPSLRSSDTANEESPSLVPGLRRSVSLSDPLFNPYHTECISITRVTHKVFETMQTVLSEKKKSDDGYIYTLRMAERPGFVKIGRTRNAIDNRKKQIKRCIIYNLETINDDDFCPVENHTRVEKLIGDELRNYRRSFPCACKQKRHDGDASDGMTSHGEWFEIDEAKAIEVVTRWRKWMSTGPYRDGSLKQREKLRINIYHKDADRMNAMVTEKDNDWRWHVFMRDTPWQLRKLWLYEILFGERYERSTCSPWDSLWKHWKSNVLFGLRRNISLDKITADTISAYEAWESGLRAAAPYADLSSAQKQRLCDGFHKAFLSCALEASSFVLYGGGMSAVPQTLRNWNNDITSSEHAYNCTAEPAIGLKAREGPTEETTAKELEITLPLTEARPDRKKLVCGMLRKE